MPMYCRSCSELVPVGTIICPKCGGPAGSKERNEFWMMPYGLRLILFYRYFARYLSYKIRGLESPADEVPFDRFFLIYVATIVVIFVLVMLKTFTPLLDFI